MSRAGWACRALFLFAILSAPSWAQSHRGALGLTAAVGAEPVYALNVAAMGESGLRLPLELGVTFGLFDHTELRASGRLGLPAVDVSGLAGSIYGGLRNSFGFDAWKTFFDLELAVHVAPFVTGGLRAGFGVQYDVLPVMGVYALISGQIGGGNALRLSGDVMIGLQFRTYLFD